MLMRSFRSIYRHYRVRPIEVNGRWTKPPRAPPTLVAMRRRPLAEVVPATPVEVIKQSPDYFWHAISLTVYF